MSSFYTPPNVRGTDKQIQYNEDGVLSASSDLTWDDSAKELGVGGDINLDDGGTFSTTVQSVTPTANRTISFPDATGTVALVSGANGTVQYNDAGTLKGNSDFTVDPDWNDASTVFTGLKLNVTNTASAAGSNLLDLQVGGTSNLSVNSLGRVIAGASTPLGGDHIFRNAFGSNQGLTFQNSSNTGQKVRISYFGLKIDGLDLRFGAAGDVGTGDLALTRDAANTLAQRNGTNAQTFRLYNTLTGSDVSATGNYERAKLEWDSNVFKIGTEKGSGGGTARELLLSYNNEATRISLGNNFSCIGVNSYLFYIGTDLQFKFQNSEFSLDAGAVINWSSTTTAGQAADIGLARDSAGVVKITDGSTGTGYLRQVPIAVASLPTAAAGNAGTRIFVSDASVAAAGNFGSVVAGGGSNTVPVYSDGGSWRIG